MKPAETMNSIILSNIFILVKQEILHILEDNKVY